MENRNKMAQWWQRYSSYISAGRLIALVLLLMSSIHGLEAQIIKDVVKWTKTVEKTGDKELTIVFAATVASEWHLYDTDMPEGGPQSTELRVDKIVGGELVGKLKADQKPTKIFDKLFEMELRYFGGKVSFRQKVKVKDPNTFALEAYIRFMACDDKTCLPPKSWEFTLTKADLGEMTADKSQGKDNQESSAAQASTDTVLSAPIADTATTASVIPAPAVGNEVSSADLWTPVIDQLKAYGDKTHEQANSSLLMILAYGFIGGLIALVTPCVWPMIPMTVSFFLKRNKDRGKAIRDAITYGLSIIVIYVSLGMIVSLVWGPAALNNLATNAIFNILFFALLVFFAISFLGGFELVLPSSWTNKIDQKADNTTGLLSIFFMAFTLSLVSFSCTGPIIGTLLVQTATTGAIVGPLAGMLGFSLALALPFTLFAVFPNMLQSLPKSGGWLNSVKVVLGFLELALALKFFSVADMAYGWHLLDREVFVSIWIVIFVLLGVYLLGKLRLPHDTPSEKTSIGGLFLGIISLSFALYMVPGLWGAPLRAISAFAPPSFTQDFSLYKGEVHAQFDDYEAGMAYAKSVGKPVLIDFSGYGCVNCRKMEAAVWSNPEVKQRLENDYVLITLMVDDKKDLPEPIVVGINGEKTKLRTIGDKWSYLQQHKFGANAQPFYVAVDAVGNLLGPSRSYDEDIKAYINFLDAGLGEYNSRKSSPKE